MEIKAPTSQSKARCLHVFLHHRSSSSLPHHPYMSFSDTLVCLKGPQIIRPYLLCSSHHVEDHIGCDWGIWQSRRLWVVVTLPWNVFSILRWKAAEGESSTSVSLFDMFTYVRCSENCLKPPKQWSACFPKLLPWPVLMQTYIRKSFKKTKLSK